MEKYDLIIIGSGPAGLTAGIYGGRARLKTLILEKGSVGGRAGSTREIVNYPAISSTTGPDLMKMFEEQAIKFGVEIRKEAVKIIDVAGDIKKVNTRRNSYEAQAVIIATGTMPRKLGIPGEEFVGRGVSYCATCDAEFYQDQEVVILGSGDQAIEEGLYICKFASSVKVVVVHDEGVLDCNELAREKAFKEPKMSFIWNSTLTEVYGNDEVEGVHIKNLKTGEITDLACQGVFFFCGMIPATDICKNQIPTSAGGWLVTGDDMNLEVGGVFAAGDVRQKYLRQISTAVGDGAAAATAAERYITEINDLKKILSNSETPVYLGFWSPEIAGSLERLNQLQKEIPLLKDSYQFLEIDVSRKKNLALRYDVVLDDINKAVLINGEQHN